MSEWKTCTLGDVVLSANTGLDAIKRAPIVEYDTGIKCLRIQDISQNKKFENWGFTAVEDKNYEKFQLRKGDIIIARTGATIGVNKFINTDLNSVFNNGLIRIKVDRNIGYSKYIYYILRSSNYLGFIENISGGTSTQPNMQINVLLSFPILLPPLPEQRAIGEVLSSLDYKIDLLHRQNKTLEALAETLFRHYFIDNAQDDWEEGKLGDIISVIESGTRPKGGIDPYLTEGIANIGAESIKGIGNFNFSATKFVTHEFFSKMKKGIVYNKDVLIYKDGAYIGRKGMFGCGFPFKDFAVNEHVFILRANELASQYFLYFALNEEDLRTLNTNSAQPGLNQTSMKSFEMVIPPKELIIIFDNEVEPLIDKILYNAKQIQTLEKIRDTLLPKLISGDVRVDTINFKQEDII